ncbi:hypothetical protein GO009_06760 [Muricauda sp. TY007]|uniref:hypothetical protein n=1 Tax=Allomuricauda sp. TY007 TaxID=2683200 RepID=UPI0013C1DC5B|nr:hypothetical protein [Muricauda sp. TY007]NDV15723.1 hypothetical protein [Muricauda sp. TY007]
MDEKEFNSTEKPTKELVESIEEITKQFTLNTFLGQINANWKIGTFRGRPSIYNLSNFRGDVIFFDRSWTIAGDVDWRNNNFGNSGTAPFFVEYNQSDDTLKVQFFDFKINVPNCQTSALIQMRYDIPSKKVMFVYRQNVAIPQNPSFGMFSNSYMVIDS